MMNSVDNKDLRVILNLSESQTLKVDQSGHLAPSSSGKNNDPKVALAIQSACEVFFQDLCKNFKGPFESKSRELLPIRKEIRAIGKIVKRFYPEVYQQKAMRELRDLARCPELIEAKLAMAQGIVPEAVAQGINGTYFIYNRKKEPCAVFKPLDMESGQEFNPKGNTNFHFLGVTPGTSYQRERITYLLDRGHFSRVPKTVIATLPRQYFDSNAKKSKQPMIKGSFQKFVKEGKDADSVPPKKIPTQEVQRVAILDIRLSNKDRHFGNLLIDPKLRFHPIDHGLVLSSCMGQRFDWMTLEQSKEPFSKESLQYIEQLDIEKDAALIQKKLPSLSKEGLLRFKFSSVLLKQGAKMGLTAHKIGELMETEFASKIFKPQLTQLSQIEAHVAHILEPHSDQSWWDRLFKPWSPAVAAPAA